MEKKNNSLRRIVSSIVLGGFLAILLCAPNVNADVVVPSEDEPWIIDYTVEDDLIIYGTANLYARVEGEIQIYGTANLYDGAYATYFIYAFPGAESNVSGSTVNIYGCAPLNTLWVLSPTYSYLQGLPPVVTVYGSRFHLVEMDEWYSSPDDQLINGTLEVFDEFDEFLFSICIYTDDVPIHLRAPGSTEKERLEAELCISPKVMNRQRMRPAVFATLRLPEDITKDDVDRDYPLTLYADDNQVGVEAKYQRIFQSCRRKSSRVKIFAFFNLGSLLDGLPDNCEEMQIQVCGQLESGQEFYGNDTIKILSPPKKRWKHWSRRTSKCRYR